MIQLSSVIESLGFVFVFLLTVNLQRSYSELYSLQPERYDRTKSRILDLFGLLLGMSALTYFDKCYQRTGVLECFYIEPNNHLFQNIIVAVFINTTLYIGGLHQELYNGGIRR